MEESSSHPADVESVQIQEAAGNRGLVENAGSWLCCLPCDWLQSNTSVHKASLSAAMILVMFLLVASPVLFLISSAPSEERIPDCRAQSTFSQEDTDDGCNKVKPVTCETSVCRSAASRVASSVAWSEDPCKDFYKFACGEWNRHQGLNARQEHVDSEIHHLLEEKTIGGRFKKIGDFYRSCLVAQDKSSIADMFSLLDDLGGYIPEDSPGPPNLSNLLSKLLKVNGAPLFDLYLDSDLYNGSRLSIFVDLPRRNEHSTRLFQPTIQDKLFQRYFSWPKLKFFEMKRLKRRAEESRAYIHMKLSSEERRMVIMKRLLQMFLPATMPADSKRTESQTILNFATMLTKLYPRAKDLAHRLQHDGAYLTTDLSKLQQTYDFINWKALFEGVFSTNVTSDDLIYVMVPSYMTKLRLIISHTQPRTVHNALLLTYATDILHEIVNSTSSEKDRPRFCMRVTVKAYSQEVSALYVTQYSQEYLNHLSTLIKDMFSQIKRTMVNRLQVISWLDDTTKAYALQKLATLRGQFLTWPQLWNDTFVDQLLQELRVNPNDFFQNVISRYRQLRSIPGDFHKIVPPDKKWAYPFVVNAFYEVTMNSIVIPFAVLNQPYFRNDVPKYITFGTMGLIFSHEILHAFDLTGVEYDEKGTKFSWMTPETKLRLEARLECVAKQYSSAFKQQVQFLGDNVNVQFDWNVTRNENMADVSGLQVAYETWQSLQEGVGDRTLPGLNLSPSQLFFLYAGQVYCTDISPEDYIVRVEKDFHTPPPQRVNGIMMNSQAFSKAFNCQVGSKMNPNKKCSTF